MEDNIYLFISDIEEIGDRFELKQRKYVY